METATIKRIEEVCTQPVCGNCCTPVGCVFSTGGVGVFVGIRVGLIVGTFVGSSIPPVFAIGIRVGLIEVLL